MSNLNDSQKELNKKKSEMYLYEYGQKYRDKVLAEVDELRNKYKDIEVPDSLNSWFEEYDTGVLEQEAKRERLFKYKKYGRRVAVLLVAIILVGSGLTFGVDAFRNRFLNMFVDEHETNTHLIVDDVSELERPEDLSNYYYPTYMTEGFTLETYSINDSMQNFIFGSSSGYIDFTVYKVNEKTELIAQIDSENADINKVNINQSEGVYTEKDNLITLSWIDEEYLYTLTGNVEIEEMMRIAEKIKYFK